VTSRLGAVRHTAATRLRATVRRRRMPGLATAKTVLAAMLSFAIAAALHTSDSPVLAPLTALLVVQLTMYETVAHGRERIISVVAGVLLAVGFASVTGLTWWSLGLVVGVSIIAGRLLRLGPHLLEVPISAMLVLAVGGSGTAALGRVVETLIGAVVGVLVNLIIAPPVYVQPASEAITELALRLGDYSRDLADAVERAEWSRRKAEDCLTEARRHGEEVARAGERLARAEESARLNPRGRLARDAQPRLRATLDALERAQVSLRNLARALLDRTFFVPEEEQDRPYTPEARTALAIVLRTVATLLCDSVAVTAQHATSPDIDEGIAGHLAELDQARDLLATALVVDAGADRAAWGQYGSLLDTVDRLRVELATALHPPATPWPPPAIAAPREAVRRALRRRRSSPAPGES
jgi:Aromatic acid exporter family member 1